MHRPPPPSRHPQHLKNPIFPSLHSTFHLGDSGSSHHGYKQMNFALLGGSAELSRISWELHSALNMRADKRKRLLSSQKEGAQHKTVMARQPLTRPPSTQGTLGPPPALPGPMGSTSEHRAGSHPTRTSAVKAMDVSLIDFSVFCGNGWNFSQCLFFT